MNKAITFLRSIRFSILMLFLLGNLSISGQDLNAEIQKSIKLLEVDQKNKAIESLNALITSNPADASLWYYLGYAQIKKGELDKALASFDKGIQINDKEPLNYVGKGYLSVLKNNPVDTKSFFDKALMITKSKNVAVLNGIGEAYLSNKQYANDAVQILLKSKSLNSSNAQTLILLGDAYLQQNKGGQAASSYENAASIDAKNAAPHYKLGILYSRSKNLEAAIAAFNKAVSIDPSYTLAYKELGEIYYAAKEGEKAVKAQETYLTLTENPEPGKRQLAFYLFMAKNYAKANESFSQIIQTPDATPTTFRFYGVSLMEIGDFEKSRTLFEQYFSKAKPEDIQANDYAYYGKALVKLKEDSLAIIAFKNSLALDSNQIEILQLHGEANYKKKNYAEAINSFSKLISMRSKPLSQDYYAIGRAYYYNNQFTEADSAFTKLIEMQPTMTVGYLWEARIKSNQDPESINGLAKPYFDKLIEIASANPEKNKNDLIEAYSYLGYYYYLKKDNNTSKSYWKKVLGLNPKDERAIEALKVIP